MTAEIQHFTQSSPCTWRKHVWRTIVREGDQVTDIFECYSKRRAKRFARACGVIGSIAKTN
jgi:hypothetical protein